ncbi:hypothetical protein CCY99_05465 [Helicobacter sp. 16-1353]|uniref:DUF502 domain-containing protein n=1 Tax=Helicobacter sp. 16-1353 TaxID=2004996 RepID=UPI000DCD20F5|nr:DUF502 domain-containing protein [Helicobacter sp. 16-1353]RAX53830.1 hypothetical protein CCY99_05465 [Helicobacter sp. 16-1353]
MNTFLSYFFKGILALLPIIILLWLIKIVYNAISGIVYYIFSSTAGSFLATTIICILVIVFFFLLGFVVERNRDAIILKITELIIGKIPVIASIYSTLKEAVNLFSGKSADNYLGVVYVTINDYKVMGFVTKELEDSYWVFVPTTPNPTSGFLLNAKKDSVEKSDLSVANGFKKLVSLGIK